MHPDHKSITIYNAQDLAPKLRELYEWCKAMSLAGHRMVVKARPETRSLKQNNLMWSCLGDLSKQVTWSGKRFTPRGWKDFITAHVYGEDLVPNDSGTGFVSIGRGSSTSEMSIKEMVAVIDYCHAFGTQQGVIWSPTSIAMDMET